MEELYRYHILADIISANAYTAIAEIGVRGGITAEYILENASCVKYYLMVDPWRGTGNHRDRAIEHEKHVRNIAESFSDKVEIRKSTSVEAAEHYQERSFDLVFIDAAHTYEAVKTDIEL